MEQKTEDPLRLPKLGPKTIGESSVREHIFPTLESSSIKDELKHQRTILAALFASEFSKSEQEYIDSLPKDPLEIKKHMGIHLAPVIIDPRISLAVVAERTGFNIKYNPSDIANWPNEKESMSGEPYIAWIEIDQSRKLPEVIDRYRAHDFFRGATLTEGIFFSILFPQVLEDTKIIFTPGSRIETMFVPSISVNANGKKEIGNPVLPLDDPAPLRGVLIAAR